jgi:Cu-Zn family superoxide dismutase
MNAIAVIDPKSSFNTIRCSGTIKFHQCSANHKTLIIFDISGLPPNTARGAHIHRLGDLTKGCSSLCEHWDPNPNQRHGSIELFGSDRHAGDMVNNIISDSGGRVQFSYNDELISLFSPFSIIGRSIVIHEREDDLGVFRNEVGINGQLTKRAEESGKTGNAGSRVACAVIGITDENFHPNCIKQK